ncbi:triose-phosphate isomerase [Acidiluteibacter ferrifornacis]|jgi:triosephosphate isomerase (TIM)|uniref:Triosephosphate isomerase n=1 Tax=Acidiluteibacter ferrifornacis TaxID=2692424 RepID=A0A6N9NM62_9FLAO|nr:triose-phosphate isomerase [Acidiluteibacter ferrifornacis]MBR9831165.1 triose-phosphate isomerase [bacterium]NBG66984.1 triose-phosphate isomerase [Acidiluteibacter ferrifornacis]
MRKKIVAGNWKMNLTVNEAESLVKELNQKVKEGVKADQLIVFPSFTNIVSVVNSIDYSINVGAQNCHESKSGAYTGEVSVDMIQSTGATVILVGHSERRAYFGETNELLAKKVDAVLAADMQAVYCCGETLPEREANNHFRVIESQISEGLFHLDESGISEVVIAYEPVWAIGTGVTASSDQAQEVHAFIRSLIEKKYGNEIAEQISILYGGSCNPKNAEELFRQKDVDGGLIGGAALKANDFIQIANSY